MSEIKPSLDDIIRAGVRHYAEKMREQEKETERWFAARERQRDEEARYGHWEYRGTDRDAYWVPGYDNWDHTDHS